MVLFQKAGKRCDTGVLYRLEEVGNLIIVRELARTFKIIDKTKDFLIPLIRIIVTGELHDGRTMERCLLVRFNLLGIPEIVPSKLELRAIRGSHPPVVEINNITVRTVVND